MTRDPRTEGQKGPFRGTQLINITSPPEVRAHGGIYANQKDAAEERSYWITGEFQFRLSTLAIT